MAIGVDSPMELRRADSVGDQKYSGGLAKNDSTDSFDIKERYTGVILGGFKIAVGTLDHISDYLVLYSLWRRGLHKIFVAGLMLDLLPGPVTAAHFSRQGHAWWRCLLLLFHPANLYVHLILSQVLADGAFSELVVAHSRQAQALLEAPMQLVFTLTLVMLR